MDFVESVYELLGGILDRWSVSRSTAARGFSGLALIDGSAAKAQQANVNDDMSGFRVPNLTLRAGFASGPIFITRTGVDGSLPI